MGPLDWICVGKQQHNIGVNLAVIVVFSSDITEIVFVSMDVTYANQIKFIFCQVCKMCEEMLGVSLGECIISISLWINWPPVYYLSSQSAKTLKQ